MNNLKQKPSVFCYITPFASQATVKHAEKLIQILGLTTRKLYFAGDKRVLISTDSPEIIKVSLPTLHYVSSIRPRFISILLWVINLIRGLIISSWFLIRKRKEIDTVICFLGLYYTPILLSARLLGKKTISFEPASDLVIMQSAYQSNWWWKIVKSLSLFLRNVNRTIADRVVIKFNVYQRARRSSEF